MLVQKHPAVPYGGTHVQNTKKVSSVIVDKIKNKKRNLRISYSIQEKQTMLYLSLRNKNF